MSAVKMQHCYEASGLIQRAELDAVLAEAVCRATVNIVVGDYQVHTRLHYRLCFAMLHRELVEKTSPSA